MNLHSEDASLIQRVNISRWFILRPVATSLLMLALALIGVLAYRLLPISALPQVDYPTIQITTLYSGASPDVVASMITAPLERQLGQMPGLAQMSSSSSGGASVITLRFDLAIRLDVAEQQVQAAINAASNLLPSDLPAPPTYSKVNPADAPVLTLAISAPALSLARVHELVETRIAQKLSQVTGVGLVAIAGGQRPAVRVQADAARLAAFHLSLEDLRLSIANANVNQAKGSFDGANRASSIDANDQLRSIEDYSRLIVAFKNGQAIRLSDVAQIIEGAENARLAAWANESPAIILNIQRQPGANVIETVNRIQATLSQLRLSLPSSVDVQILTDRTTTIRASVFDVQIELLFAIALVVMVIFVFLRSATATLIPALAVPLSLLGTFGAMFAFGFSINNLTLMALTISTGFVVDDAIVMIENISRHLEAGKKPLQAALDGSAQIGFTILSLTISLLAVLIPLLFMGDVVGRLFREFAWTMAFSIVISAIVSLTLTPMLCAYWLRSSRDSDNNSRHSLEDEKSTNHLKINSSRHSREDENSTNHLKTNSSRHSREGGNPELLNESLDSRLRGNDEKNNQHSPNNLFNSALSLYEKALRFVLRHSQWTLAGFAITLILTVGLYWVIPKGFFPVQDTGVIQAMTQANQAISFQAMSEKQQQLAQLILSDPAVESLSSFIGVDGNNATLNQGRMLINLKPHGKRNNLNNHLNNQIDDQNQNKNNHLNNLNNQNQNKTNPKITASEVIERLSAQLTKPENTVLGVSLYLQAVQDLTLEDRPTRTPYQLTLSSPDNAALDFNAQMLLAALQQESTLSDVSSDWQNQGLQTWLEIDRDAAARLGVSVSAIDNALYNAFGQRLISTIFTQSSQYRVILEVSAKDRLNPESLSRLYVPSSNAENNNINNDSNKSNVINGFKQISLSSLVRVSERPSLLSIQHVSQFPAVTIFFNPAKNSTLGQAVKSIEKILQEQKQKSAWKSGVEHEFQGAALAFQASLSNTIWLILAAVVVMYIVLGVLYESFIHPVTILSTLPSAGVGALLALMAAKLEFGMIAVIGIILLIGIVKKNAIMVIDFALDAERTRGLNPFDAVFEACLLRFRPILMTTFAALLGALPLMLGTGVGSELRHPLGITMVGGLLLSQLLTLFTTPVIYLLFSGWKLKFGNKI